MRACVHPPNHPSQMRLEEARQILGIEEAASKEQVEERFKVMFDANSEAKANSFYLQSKVFRSHEALMKEFERLEAEEKGSTAAKSAVHAHAHPPMGTLSIPLDSVETCS